MNEIIQSFLKEQEENSPNNTYKALQADCRILNQYLSSNQKPLFSLIGNSEACQYISFLSSQCAPRTVKRKVCTLRKLLEWCKEKGYLPAEIKIEISENIIPPEREYAKLEEIALLFEHCRQIFKEDEYITARAKMVTLLIILCGFKISELAEMKLSDITKEGIIKFNDDLRRKRVKFVSPDIISKPLELYLAKRKYIVKSNKFKSDNMFISFRGTTSTTLIYSDFEMIKQISGVSVTSASVRNSCIKFYYSQLTGDLIIGRLFGISQRWAELCRNNKN